MRPAQLALLSLFLLLLAGCSMPRLAYNNAEVVLRKMAHDYFDLDPRQSEEFRVRLARFHEWHRANELPVYAAFLHDASKRVAKHVSTEDAEWALSTVRARYRTLVARAADEAAPILATLTPHQVDVLEKKLAEQNAKYAKEYLSGDEKRRERTQLRRTLERFRDWMGALTPEQEARIQRFVRAHPRQAELRFEDRQRWQREAVALLRQPPPPKELGKRLGELFSHPETRRSAEFREAERRWEADLVRLLADLDPTLTPAQRAHVIQRLEGYAEDFTALSSQQGKKAA